MLIILYTIRPKIWFCLGQIWFCLGQIWFHIGQILNQIGKILNQIGQILNHPGKILNQIGKILNHPGKILNHPGKRLNHPGNILDYPGRKFGTNWHFWRGNGVHPETIPAKTGISQCCACNNRQESAIPPKLTPPLAANGYEIPAYAGMVPGGTGELCAILAIVRATIVWIPRIPPKNKNWWALLGLNQ